MSHTTTESNATLCAEALKQDPRIAEAKKLILQAVSDHRKKLTGVRPPNPGLKVNYEELLKKFASYRGGKLWFPYLGSGIGNGALVELLDGSVKYDFISGIGPHYLGHSHLELISSSIDAAIGDTIMQGHLQQNGEVVEVTEILLKLSGMDHCFLTTTGVMANENALKIAFQKKFPANRVLAFERCFVGRTLSLSQITDKPAFREGLPVNLHVDYIPYYDPAKPEESTEKAVTTLKKALSRYPKEHAVMIFELVQGEGGFYSGTKEFFVGLMKILKEHGIAIFADEVQTFGRTTELFAYHHFGLQDYVDLVSIGKLSQVCATLYKKEFVPRAGLLSQTFSGSTSAIHACKVIINTLVNGGYFGPKGMIVELHDYLAAKLQDISKRHPDLIRGPFGIGAMLAFTPYDGESQRVTKFVHDLFEAGVLSFVAGSHPTRVRFLIPVGAVTKHDIDEVAKIVEKTLIEKKI